MWWSPITATTKHSPAFPFYMRWPRSWTWTSGNCWCLPKSKPFVISNPCPEFARELKWREKSHSYQPKEKIDFSVATLLRNDKFHFIGHFELTEGNVRNLKTIKNKTSIRFLNRHYVPHFEMTHHIPLITTSQIDFSVATLLRNDVTILTVISNPCPEPARELKWREKSHSYQPKKQ